MKEHLMQFARWRDMLAKCGHATAYQQLVGQAVVCTYCLTAPKACANEGAGRIRMRARVGTIYNIDWTK